MDRPPLRLACQPAHVMVCGLRGHHVSGGATRRAACRRGGNARTIDRDDTWHIIDGRDRGALFASRYN